MSEDHSFFLHAIVKGGIMRFYLNTRDGFGKESPWPYEDLRAAAFMRVAYSFFRSQGQRIDVCHGQWYQGSLNNAQYIANLIAGMSRAKAAQNTWSGRQFTKLGFPGVMEDLIVSKFDLEDQFISAPFFLDLNKAKQYRDYFL